MKGSAVRNEIRMTSSQWQALGQHLLADHLEHAAVLICGTIAAPSSRLMLVRQVVPLAGADLIEHGELHLSVSPVTIARLAKQAAQTAGSIIICHSHPFPGSVAPSPVDLQTEAQLCGRALAGRLHPRPVGSLIVGPDGASARFYSSEHDKHPATVRIIGETITVLGPARPGPDGDEHTFDRQIRAWGADGQEAIASSHVVIVGTGGTGSHVLIQLAHLGVRNFLLIDPDRVEASNLPRLIGATPADVGSLKVDVLANAARIICPEAEIQVVAASVLDVDPGLLCDADVIFCCTDGHGSRALLTEIAQQLCVTVIDLGVEIVPSPGGARAGGGVRILRPGQACLHCAGTVDPGLVREEYLTAADRETEAIRGYLRGTAEPSPSVVALNGVAASLAVLEFCQLIAGMFATGRQRLLYRAEQRRLTTASMQVNPACHVCGCRGLLGAGDGSQFPTRWQAGAEPGTTRHAV
jgi:molybdopterin/thiamine biosynthesis adenylyltransferase